MTKREVLAELLAGNKIDIIMHDNDIRTIHMDSDGDIFDSKGDELGYDLFKFYANFRKHQGRITFTEAVVKLLQAGRSCNQKIMCFDDAHSTGGWHIINTRHGIYEGLPKSVIEAIINEEKLFYVEEDEND